MLQPCIGASCAMRSTLRDVPWKMLCIACLALEWLYWQEHCFAPPGGMTSALYVSSTKSSSFAPTAHKAGRRRRVQLCLQAELVDAVLPLSRRACMASAAFHAPPRCGMAGRMSVPGQTAAL